MLKSLAPYYQIQVRRPYPTPPAYSLARYLDSSEAGGLRHARCGWPRPTSSHANTLSHRLAGIPDAQSSARDKLGARVCLKKQPVLW